MTLRSSRRRISTRTKRRYRAIRNFLRRALGSSPHNDINIQSSIAVNVTELKQKILTTEHKINNLDQCFEVKSSDQTNNNADVKTQDENDLIRDHISGITSKLNESIISNIVNDFNDVTSVVDEEKAPSNDTKEIGIDCKLKCECCDDCVKRHKSKHSKLSPRNNKYSEKLMTKNNKKEQFCDITKSVCSCGTNADTKKQRISRSRHKSRKEKIGTYVAEDLLITPNTRDNIYHEEARRHKSSSPDKYRGQRHDNKTKRKPLLDKEFIADIVRKQYEPVTLFSLNSGLSQVSEPVCRDGEQITQKTNTKQNKAKQYYSNVQDMCDKTIRRRLKSNNIKIRDFENDDLFYDYVPVKEEANSKTRKRKCDCFEIPPSPDSQKPLLNLNADRTFYLDYEDSAVLMHRNRARPTKKQKGYLETNLMTERRIRDCSSNNKVENDNDKFQQPNMTHQEIENPTNSNTTKNELEQIKNLLHEFLLELKNGNNEIPDNKECNGPQIPNQLNNQFGLLQNMSSYNSTPGNIQYSGNGFCYPILPICPLNCVQNVYGMPNTTLSCANCQKKIVQENSQETKNEPVDLNNENEIIKEIYNYISRTSETITKLTNLQNDDNKNVDNNTTGQKHLNVDNYVLKKDVQVETDDYCAIKNAAAEPKSSQETTDNLTLSSDKRNINVIDSDTEKTDDVTLVKKTNILSKIFGYFKFKKRSNDANINDDCYLMENEKPSLVSQHNRHTDLCNHTNVNYNVVCEKYSCPESSYRSGDFEGSYRHQTMSMNASVQEIYTSQNSPRYHAHKHDNPPPTAPPYPYDPYYHVRPEIPPSFKEVEVRSTGTQSEKKMCFLKMFNIKKRPAHKKNCNVKNSKEVSTQTQSRLHCLFDWKKLKTSCQNFVDSEYQFDPTQDKLTATNNRARKAIKKLLFKRNLFPLRF